jgi:hypothetical protein
MRVALWFAAAELHDALRQQRHLLAESGDLSDE